MNPQHYPQRGNTYRTTPQKVCISMGFAFIFIGFFGVLLPSFLGMHLSMAHNLFYIICGAVALWSGYSSLNRSMAYAIGFGAIFGLLGIAGYVLGVPGYPSVGNMEADQSLFRMIPNVLEFGTMDHIVQLLISAFLLFSAYTYRKDRGQRKKP
jgi:hypothetical protein